MELSLSSIAERVNGSFVGDGEKQLSNVASFEMAGPDNITFASERKYLNKIEHTKAGAIIVPDGTEGLSGNIVFAENPKAAFATLMDVFNPVVEPYDMTHPTAVTGKNFNSGKNVMLKAGVVIGDDVRLGDRVVIQPNTVIGDGVVVGNDVTLYPNVTILNDCIIGDRVIIHSGTVIGSDGYGFTPVGETYTKIRHIGIVRIGDDVEIGANNSIDRGTFGETWIQNGVKTDNQVHIAHNVVVGENTLLVAQVGIAGSSKIGNHAILAGKVGISGHITIGDNSVIGPGSVILKSVKENQVISGSPGMPHTLWLKAQTIVSKLPVMWKQLRTLEKRIGKLENTGE